MQESSGVVGVRNPASTAAGLFQRYGTAAAAKGFSMERGWY